MHVLGVLRRACLGSADVKVVKEWTGLKTPQRRHDDRLCQLAPSVGRSSGRVVCTATYHSLGVVGEHVLVMLFPRLLVSLSDTLILPSKMDGCLKPTLGIWLFTVLRGIFSNILKTFHVLYLL